MLNDVVTLPQHFKANGYRATAFGRIFHRDDPDSWSEPLWQSDRSEYHTDFGRQVLTWIIDANAKECVRQQPAKFAAIFGKWKIVACKQKGVAANLEVIHGGIHGGKLFFDEARRELVLQFLAKHMQ